MATFFQAVLGKKIGQCWFPVRLFPCWNTKSSGQLIKPYILLAQLCRRMRVAGLCWHRAAAYGHRKTHHHFAAGTLPPESTKNIMQIACFYPQRKESKERKTTHKNHLEPHRLKKPQTLRWCWLSFWKVVNDLKGCVQFSDEPSGQHNEAISTFSATLNQECLLYLKIGLGLPCDLNVWMLHSSSSLVFFSSKVQPRMSFTYIRKINKTKITTILEKWFCHFAD